MAVFETCDNVSPHSVLGRPFSEKRKRFGFFQNSINFSRYPILAKIKRDIGQTKRDIGQTKRDIGQIKRDIGRTKRAIGQIKRDIGRTKRTIGQTKRAIKRTKRTIRQTKRALGGTPSPLPRGGRAANWDKIAPGNSPNRGISGVFMGAFLFTLALSTRESATYKLPRESHRSKRPDIF